MNEAIIYIHQQAPEKPAWMAPCNGCGVCCAAETCPLGRALFFRKRGPCPALTWKNESGRYICGILYYPGRYLRWLPTSAYSLTTKLCRRWIAVGYGCDSSIEINY